MGTGRLVVRWLIAASPLLCGPGYASGEEEMPNPSGKRVPIQSTWLNARTGRAMFHAKRKLGSERCRQVFTEFRDYFGQPLQKRLDELGQDPIRHFDRLVFFDGKGSGVCNRPQVFAASSPRGRVVYLCGEKFARLAARSPGFAAVILIHEQLHSLGLGENPPSSHEITARVMTSCGT
jgi:hypothetical protein